MEEEKRKEQELKQEEARRRKEEKRQEEELKRQEVTRLKEEKEWEEEKQKEMQAYLEHLERILSP